MNSSGFNLTLRPDGGVKIVYEDYGVGILGGGDCEVTYKLDSDNFSRLLEKIGCPSKVEATKYIRIKFGENLEKIGFSDFCDENKIRYKKNVWCS